MAGYNTLHYAKVRNGTKRKDSVWCMNKRKINRGRDEYNIWNDITWSHFNTNHHMKQQQNEDKKDTMTRNNEK